MYVYVDKVKGLYICITDSPIVRGKEDKSVVIYSSIFQCLKNHTNTVIKGSLMKGEYNGFIMVNTCACKHIMYYTCMYTYICVCVSMRECVCVCT